MIFLFLLGIGLVALGVGSLAGGGWATVGAVVLLVLGAKLLFGAIMFRFFGRRLRAGRWHWAPGVAGRYGRWPCGRGSESIRTRMDAWHEMAHAGVETDAGSADQDDATAE